MSDPFFSQMLHNATIVAPQLVVCLVAVVLAVVYRRHRTPAMLVMLGGTLLFLTMLGNVFAQQYVIQQGEDEDLPNKQVAATLYLVAVIGSSLRALSLLLIVIAAFVGRGRANATPQPVRQ
jgi:hypothetical protein